MAKPILHSCLRCGKPMPKDLLMGAGTRKQSTRSSSIANMDKKGIFCTLRCAARHGVALAESQLASGMWAQYRNEARS